MSSNNDLWWMQHRRQKYKIQKRISKEKIVRRCLRETFVEYMKRSSLPGLGKLVDPGIGKTERCYMLLVMLSVAGLLSYSLYLTWTDVLSRPLIVSMESTVHPIRKMEFPAVAFCNVNRVSKQAARQYAETQVQPHFPEAPLEKLVYIIEQLGRLIDFEITGMQEMLEFISHLPLSYVNSLNMTQLMQKISEVGTHLGFNYDAGPTSYSISLLQVKTIVKLSPACDKLLVRCFWHGRLYPCQQLMQRRLTSHGHCCVFNYVIKFNNFQKPTRYLSEARRQVVPSFKYGLNIVLNPEIDDYAYPLHNAHGIDVLLFDPNHFADHNNGLLVHRVVAPNAGVLLELKTRQQIATREIRKYSLETRKCLFSDERPKKFGDMYSYSSCIILCRVRTVQTLCKCTPYYLPSKPNDTVCTLANLHCLNKYKEKLMYLYPRSSENTDGLDIELQDSLYCPNCLPDCEYTRHFTRAFTLYNMNANEKHLQYRSLTGLNMTNKSFVSIFYLTGDGVLDRLDVVYYWYELLSNFGGMAGLLIGYSITSSIEIIYFIIIHLFKQIYTQIKESNQ